MTDTPDTTKVTMTASDYVVEGGTITYTVNLSNAAGTDMTVKLSNGESVVIKAGDKSGTITVPAPADDVYKDGSKITVGIASTDGGNFEKLDVSNTTHTTTVNDTSGHHHAEAQFRCEHCRRRWPDHLHRHVSAIRPTQR